MKCSVIRLECGNNGLSAAWLCPVSLRFEIRQWSTPRDCNCKETLEAISIIPLSSPYLFPRLPSVLTNSLCSDDNHPLNYQQSLAIDTIHPVF